MKKELVNYLLILVAALLYAVATVLFLYPNQLILGGTSGISVILSAWLPFSPGSILAIINVLLLVIAFVVLGMSVGIKTLVGSLATTFAITGVEQILHIESPIIENHFLAALAGAAIIAVASGVMFYVGASSGGTDVLALILKKYTTLHIGRALLVTDFLIVVLGSFVLGLYVGAASLVGLLIKTFGIDYVISLVEKMKKRRSSKTELE